MIFKIMFKSVLKKTLKMIIFDLEKPGKKLEFQSFFPVGTMHDLEIKQNRKNPLELITLGTKSYDVS